MSEGTIWCDGKLVGFEQATVHVLSHAANRGSEVFDVLRLVSTDNGPAAVGLRPHVARFDQSMELMGMSHPFDISTIEQAVADTAQANPGTGVIKLIAAWTEIAMVSVPVSTTPSVFVAAVGDISEDPVMSKPVAVATSEMPKIPAAILPPGLKVAAGYTPGLRRQMALAETEFDEVIFRSAEGKLAEATTQSLLVVSGERLLAPPVDTVLDGITRRLVMDAARSHGMAVEIRDVHWDEVENADELILSSTNHFIRPLSRLDDRLFDAPGPVASKLADTLNDVMGLRHELSTRWVTPLAGIGSK